MLCSIRCKDTPHAREVISHIMSLSGVQRTETMICLEESINSKNRLIKNMLEEYLDAHRLMATYLILKCGTLILDLAMYVI